MFTVRSPRDKAWRLSSTRRRRTTHHYTLTFPTLTSSTQRRMRITHRLLRCAASRSTLAVASQRLLALHVPCPPRSSFLPRAMSSLPADYQPPSADSLPKGPSATALQATREYALSHTMYRIKDPRVSIPFYTETLGMSLISRSDSQGGKFTNYFLLSVLHTSLGYRHLVSRSTSSHLLSHSPRRYPQSPVPEDEEAKKSWLWSQQGIIELCHNWSLFQPSLASLLLLPCFPLTAPLSVSALQGY